MQLACQNILHQVRENNYIEIKKQQLSNIFKIVHVCFYVNGITIELYKYTQAL